MVRTEVCFGTSAYANVFIERRGLTGNISKHQLLFGFVSQDLQLTPAVVCHIHLIQVSVCTAMNWPLFQSDRWS